MSWPKEMDVRFAKSMYLFLSLMPAYVRSALILNFVSDFIFCFAVVLWLTMIVSGMCMYGTIPLFLEIVCESTYPIAEGVTTGFLTWLNNVVGLVFLLVVMIPMGEFAGVRPTELSDCFYILQKYLV